jgi:hypothetical protein
VTVIKIRFALERRQRFCKPEFSDADNNFARSAVAFASHAAGKRPGKARKMSGRTITVGGTGIAAGKSDTVDLPIANLYTHTSLNMPVHVVNGKQDGPVLFVTSALHGDELNGVEIINRLLKRVSPKSLRGCILAIPIVNVFGFLNQSR